MQEGQDDLASSSSRRDHKDAEDLISHEKSQWKMETEMAEMVT